MISEQLLSDIRSLSTDDFVVLTDEQTISALIEDSDPNSMHGRAYRIVSIQSFSHRSVKELSFRLFRLETAVLSEWPDLFLGVFGENDATELKILFHIEDWESGDRDDLSDDQLRFLFESPQEPRSDMEYRETLNLDLAELEGCEAAFQCVLPETTYLEEISDDSYESGVIRYRSEMSISNPELIVVESGLLDEESRLRDQGGFIELFMGAVLLENDIQILNQSA